MKKAIKVNLVLLIMLILFFILTSCKAKIQYVPIESVRTEYMNKYLRDSVMRYDSIFVKEKGDSVWLEKYKYIYRDRFRTDTIMQTDSIQVPYPVEKQLSKWEKVKMEAGGWAIGVASCLLIILVIYIIRRFN